jgi:hypothetical protein
MEIYVLLISDRHCDPEPQVFTSQVEALTTANSFMDEYGMERNGKLPKDMLFCASNEEGESCYVYIRKIEVGTA